jgi:Na+-driven multidrug efflux pump
MKVLIMRRISHLLILLATAISVIAVSAVCWHSVEEIHYLKTFYPRQFTVEEAFYASGVEFFKVLIITVPFLFALAAGSILLRHWKRKE